MKEDVGLEDVKHLKLPLGNILDNPRKDGITHVLHESNSIWRNITTDSEIYPLERSYSLEISDRDEKIHEFRERFSKNNTFLSEKKKCSDEHFNDKNTESENTSIKENRKVVTTRSGHIVKELQRFKSS